MACEFFAMKTSRTIKGLRYLLYGTSERAPYAGDLADLDLHIRQRRHKSSKRNRGLPGWKRGAASNVRVLSGDEFESRKRELEAREQTRSGLLQNDATFSVASSTSEQSL